MGIISIDSYLTVWSPVGGTVSEGLGGMILLEEMCHWGWTSRFQKTHAILNVDSPSPTYKSGSRWELPAGATALSLLHHGTLTL